MKLRVRGNSIRLRLTQSEIVRFGETGLVEEIIEFGGESKLIYALESSAQAKSVEAGFSENRVVVIIPQSKAENWTNSNKVGIKAEQSIGDNKILRLLIEKDFACLEPREGEEDADTFPHPAGNTKC